jgi:hypothetical protein
LPGGIEQEQLVFGHRFEPGNSKMLSRCSTTRLRYKIGKYVTGGKSNITYQKIIKIFTLATSFIATKGG